MDSNERVPGLSAYQVSHAASSQAKRVNANSLSARCSAKLVPFSVASTFLEMALVGLVGLVGPEIPEQEPPDRALGYEHSPHRSPPKRRVLSAWGTGTSYRGSRLGS